MLNLFPTFSYHDLSLLSTTIHTGDISVAWILPAAYHALNTPQVHVHLQL